ncbi:hypothetical protein JTB14_019641 [Gonioctena quinquepunctata]|nr:hypothetical protein JTB14_019641 [Gonioctena quinquepunctata]
MRCEMPGMPRSTFLMVFSPDGSKVASTHGNHNIYITDLRNGKNIKTLVGHPRTPWCIAFHPTSDQIVASGCLGGQVRIWDLSGGSEVWTAVNQTVIASLAFHPNDRVLAIATHNGVYFWDWSQPEPFVHAATYNVKEKVRYVAFDSGPQTHHWHSEQPYDEVGEGQSSGTCTQTGAFNTTSQNPLPSATEVINNINQRGSSLTYPERERRITLCYRTLVREYEQLVQRYLQLYRPPTMIDRGTDPMEPNPWFNNSGTQTPSEPKPSTSGTSQGPGTSGTSLGSGTSSSSPRPGTSSSSPRPGTSSTSPRPGTSSASPRPGTGGTVNNSNSSDSIALEICGPSVSRDVGPSTSGGSHIGNSGGTDSSNGPDIGESTSTPSTSSHSPQKSAHNLLTPSRIFSVIKKPDTLIRGTQTSESRKHKSEDCDEPKEKRLKKNDEIVPKNSGNESEICQPTSSADNGKVPTSRRMVVIDVAKPGGSSDPDGDTPSTSSSPSTSGFRVRSAQDEDGGQQVRSHQNDSGEHISARVFFSLPSTSRGTDSVDSTEQSNVDELLSSIRRTAEEEVRNRILPIIRSVPANDRPELIRLFENSREHVRMRFRQMYPVFLRKSNRRLPNNPIDTTSESSSSEEEANARLTRRNSEPTSSNVNTATSPSTVSSTGASTSNPNIVSSSNSSTVRNFNTELEQLVTSLLTEIERNETDNAESSGNSNVNTQTTAAENVQETSVPVQPHTCRLPKPTVTYCRRPPSSGTLPVPSLPTETTPTPSAPPPPTTSSPLSGSLLFQEFIQVFQNRMPNPERMRDSPFEPPATVANTNTRTTNSTVYTSSGGPATRRRFFSHRISAFMPTRVNYTRNPSRLRRSSHHLWGRSRLNSRGYGNSSFGLDELINYSELENSEDDPPPPPPPPDADHPADPTNPSDTAIGDMYSNMVQELESSLENVVRMRVSTRPGEASNMLSSFSERLESILSQSDVILRNLSSSMELLGSTTPTRRYNTTESTEPPTWNYFDPNFYIRDQRTEGLPSDLNASDTINLSDIFSPRPPYSAVASDHTYPRNPDNVHVPPPPESSTPMMATIHLTIMHIQRQARLLRQQVENIEQIDRAMLEVEQLQLVRRLIIELVRHVRTLGGENSRSTGGMSSVRQMMAGTRISDSSPYDSPAEEVPPSVGTSASTSATPPPPSSSNTSTTEGQTTSGSGTLGGQTGTRPRSSSRKTYPPSRMFRLARQCRRPSVWHFFSRRYSNQRNTRQNSQARSARTAPNQDPSGSRYPSFSSYAVIDTGRLSLMTRRLEQLLTEQMRVFTSPEPPRPNNRSMATIDLGEHILALRLHGCVLRMNRVLGNGIGSTTIGQLRADPTAAVTQDGVARYGARHLLSLIIDSVSRHVEEMGTSSNIQNSTRMQIQGVLAMSLLLTELLLLVVVDSIPPPTGIDSNPERVSLTSRVDQLCSLMLQNRQCTYSQQLTRSLRLMKLTMRHAHSALGQTYHARRNAMLPRQYTDRRLLLGSINAKIAVALYFLKKLLWRKYLRIVQALIWKRRRRCLRTINRRRQTPNTANQETPPQEAAADNVTPASSTAGGDWYSTVSDLISQYSTLNREDDVDNQPSTSGRERVNRPPQNDVSSNNENSDDDDTEPYSVSSTSSNLYRTSNVNLAPSSESPNARPWNVPLVQVNDVPISEPSPTPFAQRLISQRQRFAERVSELRSNPQMGLFRPRFLHPLYASVNPFDADLDDPQREQIYDSDMITTVTPNHRIQAWDVSDWTVPNIGSPTRNIVVSECKIHNDASVDVAKDGTILVTLLPSGGYLNVTNRLGVYSLRWETLGQCLYTTSFEQNAVSVSLSPLSRHLVVGLASRIVPSERWIMARVFKIDQKDEPGDRLPVIRELEQNRDSRINCIRWLPASGQGLIYATNTGQLVVLS